MKKSKLNMRLKKKLFKSQIILKNYNIFAMVTFFSLWTLDAIVFYIEL